PGSGAPSASWSRKSFSAVGTGGRPVPSTRVFHRASGDDITGGNRERQAGSGLPADPGCAILRVGCRSPPAPAPVRRGNRVPRPPAGPRREAGARREKTSYGPDTCKSAGAPAAPRRTGGLERVRGIVHPSPPSLGAAAGPAAV